MMDLNYNFIMKLYKTYLDDLITVRKFEKEFISKFGFSSIEKSTIYRIFKKILRKGGVYKIDKRKILYPQTSDIDLEITYLLIRELKPKIIVEIGSYGGWSSSWILNALKDNNYGHLYSYDLIDILLYTLPTELKERLTFSKGDIKKNYVNLPKNIDYLFMDADHRSEFTIWYIKNILANLRKGTRVSIHDIFLYDYNFYRGYGESTLIKNWLNENNIKYFTVSIEKNKKTYDKIMLLRNSLGLNKEINIWSLNEVSVLTNLKRNIKLINNFSNHLVNNCSMVFFEIH